MLSVGKYKTLLVNLGLFTLNTVSTKLITFILVPLYTYFLTAAQFGITDMSLTVVSLVAPIVTLSIGDAATRYIIDDSKDQGRYISVGFWVTLFGCIVVLALLPLLDLPIFGGLGSYKWFYMAYFVSSTFNAYLANVARGLNNVKLITWASIASSLASASSAGVLIGWLNWKVEGYFISLILGGVLAIILYLIFGRALQYIGIPRIKEDRQYLKRMLLYSIPLMPNSIFWWVGTSVNRFFITSMLGIGASGLFAAASKIPNIMNLISSTFWQAWSLSAFQQFKKTDTSKFYSNVFAVFRTFCFVAASGLTLVSPWLASILLQKNFYEGWVIIPILVLAFLFNVFAGFYGTIFTASMKTAYLLTSTAAAALVVIGMTWLLIPLIGLQGAAWAMVASNFVMYIMRVFRAGSIMKIKVNRFLMVANMVLVVLQVCLMLWQPPQFMVFSGMIFIGVCVVACFDFYPSIRTIVGVMRKNRGSHNRKVEQGEV